MELKNKQHEVATDFYFKNKQKIGYVRKMTLIVMMSLKKTQKLLSRFDEVKVASDHNLNLLIVIYRGYLLSGSDFKITFKVSLSDLPNSSTLEIKSFCNGDIAIRAGSFSNREEMIELIEKRISTIIFGLESEAVFYRNFLLPFKKRFSEEIIFVHYAGKNNDLKKGVDYEIGFRPRGQHNVFNVDFNLKSSDRYLEDHKKKHPKVSTFIFKRKFLDDWDTLKKKFFRFLNEVVRKEVAHH